MNRYDLTDFEWSVIEPLLPNRPASRSSRPARRASPGRERPRLRSDPADFNRIAARELSMPVVAGLASLHRTRAAPDDGNAAPGPSIATERHELPTTKLSKFAVVPSRARNSGKFPTPVCPPDRPRMIPLRFPIPGRRMYPVDRNSPKRRNCTRFPHRAARAPSCCPSAVPSEGCPISTISNPSDAIRRRRLSPVRSRPATIQDPRRRPDALRRPRPKRLAHRHARLLNRRVEARSARQLHRMDATTAREEPPP